MSQQSAAHYLRHGQNPFFRLPVADISVGGPDAYAGADAVLLGVPYDGGTTYQPGARLAPYHVRRVSALVQGEMMGSSIGPILRAQSEQRRTERFQRAEKLALEAPVKMLGPLIMCIFPCTFIVIGFPIVMQLKTAGL